MRRAALILLTLALSLLALVWGLGGFEALARWALDAQREAQAVMAGALRALRAGTPGALIGLFAIAFSYGFLHAAGPGHGKVLLAGYGAARRVGARRLIGLALVSSLAQAAVAVALVYAGVLVLGWGRESLGAFADRQLTALGQAMILALGLWLVWRGARRFWRVQAGRPGSDDRAPAPERGHDHAETLASGRPRPHMTTQAEGHAAGHSDDAHCGHAHLPDAEAIAAATSWREQLALVAGVAVRPCTGAVLILLLTWQMGIALAGIAAAFVMALGTASVTMVVALGAGLLREGALRGLPEGRALVLAMPVIELGAGLVLALVSGRLLLG